MDELSVNNSANSNDEPECEVEYLELIERMTKTLEALLADPSDKNAWDNARAIVDGIREPE